LEDALKLKGAKRITYTEITEKAVKTALAKPRLVDMALVAAQERRRVLDRLVGYMVSPALCDRVGKRVSAGRVQTPAVRLVVEREREIGNFRVTVHYGVELVFDGWKAVWLPKKGWLPEGREFVLDKSIAEQVAAIRKVEVRDCQESESKVPPPPPFITSTLQQAASSSLKFSPKQTMKLAQGLYESGHITYMRTDSPNLSDEAVAEIRRWAAEHDFPVPVVPRTWKVKAGAQEAHEAIRPTHIDLEEAGDSEGEKALYRLIRLRAIASQLEDAVFAIRIVLLDGDVNGKTAVFEAKGRTPVKAGWKALVATDQTEEEEGEPDNKVPKLGAGTTMTAKEGKVLTKKTKPPARFTEASLIKELERRWIGRPSTYASILENIMTRAYLVIEKRFLVPTATGEEIVDTLVGRFGFTDYDFTKRIEDELDLIAERKTKYITVVNSAYEGLRKELNGFGGTEHKCPKCGKPLRHLVRADSKEKKGYDFWSCTGYPDCKTSFDNKDGKPDFEGKAKQKV
jgi:DNA topoisomerase-1